MMMMVLGVSILSDITQIQKKEKCLKPSTTLQPYLWTQEKNDRSPLNAIIWILNRTIKTSAKNIRSGKHKTQKFCVCTAGFCILFNSSNTPEDVDIMMQYYRCTGFPASHNKPEGTLNTGHLFSGAG